jgi:hypothetical protein
MSKNMWDGMIAAISKGDRPKAPGFKPAKGEFPGVDIDAVHNRAEIKAEIKSYPTAGVWLTEGFYKLDELKAIVAGLEHLKKANDKSMRKLK